MALADARHLYLDLIERCLLGLIYEDPSQDPWSKPEFDPEKRIRGLDWPLRAHTMIGKFRMENLRGAVEHVLKNSVPGDLIETGVWRGGACIYMRAILKAYGIDDRTVWVADSFEGLPLPDPERYPADRGDAHHKYPELAISLEEVQANFAKYGLLDDQVRFLKGWFKDTLPTAPIEKLAILRLDGDMYESTMDALTALYEKVSPGGVIIVDDFGVIPACRQAIHDFRNARRIDAPIQPIDGVGIYWIKQA
ncbi:MAG TPA: TylF/MycF family methyltransferase [Candidatus Cybelea sp.]|nr:TylF/MycF family methyltransferase [Candidatus Cybelea sp.]